MTTALKVGDKVQYIPALFHATHKDPKTNERAWIVGRKSNKDGKEIITELRGKAVGEFLHTIRKHPNPTLARKELAYIRPNVEWTATVAKVNEDDTVNIDIPVPNMGYTLHYKSIKIDPNKAPHTVSTQRPAAPAPVQHTPPVKAPEPEPAAKK